MLQVTFAEVSGLLESLGCEVPAAEAHGCLCGALCINERYSFEHWREELLADADADADADEETARAPADEQLLHSLFSKTALALNENTEDFTPLLPDDDVALEQRTSALAQWSAGFLYGLGSAAPRFSAPLPAAVDEILRDFARIATASTDTDSDPEEQEHAYAELIEYLRAGVWLIYAELTAVRANPPAPPDSRDD
jgi:uncharacterized protein YgfB (UPF0149 family)